MGVLLSIWVVINKSWAVIKPKLGSSLQIMQCNVLAYYNPYNQHDSESTVWDQMRNKISVPLQH